MRSALVATVVLASWSAWAPAARAADDEPSPPAAGQPGAGAASDGSTAAAQPNQPTLAAPLPAAAPASFPPPAAQPGQPGQPTLASQPPEHWDVLVDLRFGIDSDFTRSHQFAIAPGFRYWVDPELPFKFFATVQGVFDATAQGDPRLQDNDFGFRNSNGFMFEVMSNLGIYLQFGETLGFRRWLRFEIDGGVGVQARIP